MPNSLSISAEVWIATAQLHRSNPDRDSFSEREIKDAVKRLGAFPTVRPGVQWHVSLHTVANLPPNPAKVRMLYKLPDGTLRLFRPGDNAHPGRTGPSVPAWLPQKYTELLDWYRKEYCPSEGNNMSEDPVLALRGLGKEVWTNTNADDLIRELRSDAPVSIEEEVTRG